MKIPATPPHWEAAFDNLLGSPKFNKALTEVIAPTLGGNYVHWDKLRHLEAPHPLTHAEWWSLIKFRRALLLRPVPLQDTRGTPFQFAVPDSAAELLHGLDKDAAGHLLMSGQVATADRRDQYIVRSLMEEAITSSQLEGAATTRVVAKQMLRSGRAPRDRGEQMIANNYAAMRRIREVRDRELTPDLVFDLHRILTANAIDDPSGVGRLRRPEERVLVEDAYGEVLHTPPPAEQLRDRLVAMCAFANGKTPGHFVHPVVRAIALHFWLAYDHPFIDGNGRCARALFYWSMLKSGYWLCEFISISEAIKKAHARYGRAFLYTETDGNDLTYFLLYHLDLIRKAIDALREYLDRKQSEVREAERLLRADEDLNHRQLVLLSDALRHPDASYTLAEHQASHNVVYETARTDLFDLRDKGFLVARKRGRTYHFFPAEGLETRLKCRR